MRVRAFVGRASVAILAMCWTARAKSFDSPQPCLEQVLNDAKFVGVARCETAGNWVARYQVLETWKGCAPAASLTILGSTAVALVGERFVIVVSDRAQVTVANAPFTRARMKLDADCDAESVRLPPRGERPFATFGRDDADVNALRSDVLAFNALSPAEQDLRTLRCMSECGFAKEPDPSSAAVLTAVHGARTLHDAIAAISAPSGKEQESAALALVDGLRSEAALAELESVACDDSSSFRRRMARVIDRLRERVAPTRSVTSRSRDLPLRDASSAASLDVLRASLARGQSDRGFAAALRALTEREPATVADFLASGPELRASIEITTDFARRCTGDRPAHLRRLLDAKDPMRRVVGAVYLRFEDPNDGAARLRELTALDGDAGAWAALVLAGHGDRDTMERALDAFAIPSHRSSIDSVHRDLRNRLLALLSNSAHASELELPASIGDAGDSAEGWSEIHSVAREWWRANRDAIAVTDPWAAALDAQKVD